MATKPPTSKWYPSNQQPKMGLMNPGLTFSPNIWKKIYPKMDSVQCTNTHHDVADLVIHRIFKNKKA